MSDLVLFDGMDADRAVQQVQADDPAATPTPSALSTLLIGRPIAAIPGGAETCTGPAVAPPTLSEAARRARARLDYLEPDGAVAEVDAALRSAPCLAGAADADDLARLLFLRGIAHAAAGRTKEATVAFVQAKAFAPGLAWDPAYPADAKPLFDAAASTDVRFSLEVFPPRGDAVVVDGVGGLASTDLLAGDHLVQAVADGTTGAWVRLEADTLVILPTLVSDGDVRAVTDPAQAAPLARALATAVPETADVYVALPKGTWRLSPGDTEWTLVARHHPGLRRVVSPLTMAAGGALTLGGGAIYAMSYAQGSRAWHDGDASTGATWAEYDAARPTYDAAKRRMGTGAAIAGAGALVAGVGVTMQLGGGR
jgi:hypothetical protein